MKYMGTREGVEKLPYGIDHSPSTKKQQDLIASIVKKYPTATDYPEYIEYQQKKKPPRQSSLTLSPSKILIALAISRNWLDMWFVPFQSNFSLMKLDYFIFFSYILHDLMPCSWNNYYRTYLQKIG